MPLTIFKNSYDTNKILLNSVIPKTPYGDGKVLLPTSEKPFRLSPHAKVVSSLPKRPYVFLALSPPPTGP